jgi:hypothetical protein
LLLCQAEGEILQQQEGGQEATTIKSKVAQTGLLTCFFDREDASG